MTLAHDRATEFLEGIRRQQRTIVTPEGVPVTVELADHGERMTAFAIDVFIWFLLTILVYLPLVFFALGGKNSALIGLSIVLFVGFVVRNLYFIHFELAWRGATPGKRMLGLRVIDHRGGPLLPGAIIARNLTREVEMFLPLGLLLSIKAGAPIWAQLSLVAWLITFVALPFFNRDRRRGGDLIGGTIVIALPRRVLLDDLVAPAAGFSFTDKQLAAYGAFELQILEDVLRRAEMPDMARTRRQVCDRICRKIAWPTPVDDNTVLAFLKDFYTAQRAYLEREQLLGRRRADKHGPG